MKFVFSTAGKIETLRLILRSLRNRNYRLFFVGQGISLVGTWMQQIALSWLVYRLTDSPFYLGLMAFCSQIPTLLIALFAGVLADRFDKRRILLATQAGSMAQAALLTILVMSGHVVIWHLIFLSALLGVINGFDMPTRQAFVYELVASPDDLPNAIALNSMIFNGARLIGPSIAGLIIGAAGEGLCFLLNAVSYLAVLAALYAMKTTFVKSAQPPGDVLSGLKDGVAYAYRSMPIRTILLLLSLVSLVGMAYGVLMPVFARDILQGGPHTLGFLMGAVGVGAIAGALYLASRKSVHGLGRVIAVAITAFGVGLIAFSFSTTLWFSLVLMLVSGFGLMVQMASINTVLQTIVDDAMRGRVMSLYTMAFMGTAPLGGLLIGSAAGAIGAPHTLQISGLLCLMAAAVFAGKLPAIEKLIHPIYLRKGLLPQAPANELRV